ncbi:MAG: hypothetical protein RLZZ292_894 [Bacteroidota bacterium]
MRITKGNLQKLEDFFKAIEYSVRYEKGSFTSGYCLVENKKIAVINKFFDLEGRINALIDILNHIEINEAELDETSLKLYEKIKKDAENNDE